MLAASCLPCFAWCQVVHCVLLAFVRRLSAENSLFLFLLLLRLGSVAGEAGCVGAASWREPVTHLQLSRACLCVEEEPASGRWDAADDDNDEGLAAQLPAAPTDNGSSDHHHQQQQQQQQQSEQSPKVRVRPGRRQRGGNGSQPAQPDAEEESQGAAIDEALRQKHLRDMSIRAEQRNNMQLLDKIKGLIYTGGKKEQAAPPSKPPRSPFIDHSQKRRSSPHLGEIGRPQSSPMVMNRRERAEQAPVIERSQSSVGARETGAASPLAKHSAAKSGNALRRQAESPAPAAAVAPAPAARSVACFACSRECPIGANDGDMVTCPHCGCTVLVPKAETAADKLAGKETKKKKRWSLGIGKKKTSS